MIEFRRNDDGTIEAVKDGESVGAVITMGDEAKKTKHSDDDDDIDEGVGIIVVKDGKILVGTRDDNGQICGPGGHMKIGESPEKAAQRETIEEFSILPLTLLPLGKIEASQRLYEDSTVYLCDDYQPLYEDTDKEMSQATFMDLEALLDRDDLFPPFKQSLELLVDMVKNNLTSDSTKDMITPEENIDYDSDDYIWECTNADINEDGGAGSGNHGHAGRRGQRGGSAKKGSWPSNFPKVMVQTNTARMKSDPHYEAAKHGDYEEAKKLVLDVVKDDRMKLLSESYPDAIVVPVESKATGTNKIPTAYADKFADYGMDVRHDIQITKKANHTEKSEVERLMSGNEYSGDVAQGRKYIIVDDVVTNGGTVNGLRQYIEERGGTVVAISSLTAGRGSTEIAPSEKTLNAVYEKHGVERINAFTEAIGIKNGIQSMTNREVNLIRSMKPETVDKYIERG